MRCAGNEIRAAGLLTVVGRKSLPYIAIGIECKGQLYGVLYVYEIGHEEPIAVI